VLNDIRQYAELAKNHEQKFVEALNISNSDNTKKQLAQYEKQIVKSEKRLSEISMIIKRLYEDSVIGKLTDERFSEMSKGYETESADLKETVREAQKAIVAHKDANSNSRQFTALIQKYFNVEALDAPMLNEIVNKIEVHEREITNNGERVQKIDIYYNFVGIIDQAREHRTAAYRWFP
jgi:predicted ATPase with chaperone activity